MADLSPIMTLFREFEEKYKQSCDETIDDNVADGLLDECSKLEKRIMALPVSSAQDLAAMLVVYTRYGDYAAGDVGSGGPLDQALAILAVREHPDAKLTELGRQFECAKAECVPLEREWRERLSAYEAAKKDAGLDDIAAITPEIKKAWRKLSRQVGFEPIAKAFGAQHGKLIRLMKAIHRTKATTLEGFAVKAMAVAFDQSDFEVDDPVPTDVAERELYRLARDMAKVVKAGGAHG